MARNVNRDNLIVVRLMQLRRHLRVCRQCRAAMSGNSFDDLCDDSKRDLIEVARRWDAIIPGRIAISKAGKQMQFLCPDISAHGAAYEATAEPITVESVQNSLF